MGQVLKMRNAVLLSFFWIGMFFMYACSDDSNSASGYDAGRPVEITEFSPAGGPARTRLYIFGRNFGTDVSQIHVRVGGLDAKVVGSNGEIIYCIVPSKAYDGTVEVSVGEGGAYVQAPQKFAYEARPQVKTLCGYIDEYGETEVVDGSFDVCGFRGVRWMEVDPQNPDLIYVSDNLEAIRIVDVANENVSTLLTKGQGNWNNIRQLSFSETGDTLMISNEESTETATAVSLLYRRDQFKIPDDVVFANECNACVTHPINGELYYNSRKTGELFRYDWDSKESTRQYTVIGEGSQYFIFFHPTGNYAYICVPNKKVIMKSEYNWATRTLTTPAIFVGKEGTQGFTDGTGGNAILGNPYQGCFVLNEDYVAQGKEDVYDFYFCDQYAHAIRYLTPEAEVHTFAGRGSKGLDAEAKGYVDGDLLEEARFNEPSAITFDEVNRIFYIGDFMNKRIRVIDLKGE